MRSILQLTAFATVALGIMPTAAHADFNLVPVMSSGRLSRLPVSWFETSTFRSSTGLAVRTICSGDNDTGIVVRTDSNTYFNDDSTQAGGNGRGSYVNVPPIPHVPAITYTVHV